MKKGISFSRNKRIRDLLAKRRKRALVALEAGRISNPAEILNLVRAQLAAWKFGGPHTELDAAVALLKQLATIAKSTRRNG